MWQARLNASTRSSDLSRTRLVAARTWARRIIGHYMSVSPSEIVFDFGEYGKPLVRKAPGSVQLEFSLSHSGDVAILGVTGGARIGLDVEWCHRPADYLAIAGRFFSPAEYAELRDSPNDSSLAERFLVCWTRKEAYVKATGFGLTRGLGHFDVTVAPEVPARLITDRLDPSAADRWELMDIRVPEGYCAALAVEAPVAKLIYHEAEDLTLV